ncbi:MAG: DegT/DnrJ/EryC1/StrS family aminotransferase [Methanosarcinales archaeon]
MIPLAEPDIGPKELKYVKDAVESGWVSSLGYYVEKFENDFAKYCNCKYGVTVSNGTVALHLALSALGIKKGDEVIIPNFTFAATANAVIYTGATPIFVDCEQDTWNIDVSLIEEKITPKTKAIMPVHIFGHPCDMEPILEIAKKYSLFIIEDCAEAHGAEYRKKKVGLFSDISCFSFYGNKIITTGEGGICLTNSDELNQKMRLLRDHGMRKENKYWHEVVGFNYRMTNLQAALGLAQLERIEEFIKIKRRNAQEFKNLLKDVDWITLPVEKEYAKNIYWVFAILINENSRYSRNQIIDILGKEGIECRHFFYPLSIMPPYKEHYSYPVSEKISKQGLWLPSSTKLKPSDINYIHHKLINI